MPSQCTQCKGKGKIMLDTGSTQICFRCGGDGEVGKRKCNKCNTNLVYCGYYGWFCMACSKKTGLYNDSHGWQRHKGTCFGCKQDLAKNHVLK